MPPRSVNIEYRWLSGRCIDEFNDSVAAWLGSSEDAEALHLAIIQSPQRLKGRFVPHAMTQMHPLTTTDHSLGGTRISR